MGSTSFIDRHGVEWTIEWREAEIVAERVAGEPEALPQGLEFTSSALRFRVPMSYKVDPRLLTTSALQSMVDRGCARDESEPGHESGLAWTEET